MLSKQCTKCKIDKASNCFYKHKAYKDGLRPACKMCTKRYSKEYHQKNSEQKKEYMKKWRMENKEKMNETGTQWKRDNKEKVRAYAEKHRHSQGYCVYSAIYPEGEYIGSGQTSKRKISHLSGNSVIAKKLQSTAISFNIIYICYEEYCKDLEQMVINTIGIGNLLNTLKAA